MKLTIDEVTRDYLALRGESPELLATLTEGEEASAVLPLSRKIAARLPRAAVQATLTTPFLCHDEVKAAEPRLELDKRGVITARMPDDYLRLYSLRMADWTEPVRQPEPRESLRWWLGANAPGWMCCKEHPMVVEDRDAGGIVLRVYGSEACDLPATLLYVPVPLFDGNTLVISRAAYYEMLETL